MKGKRNRKASYDLGLRAEIWAALYFRIKGYRVLKKRYKTRFGEIDLVLQKGKTLVFLEVKARDSLEDTLQAIHRQNRRRVEQAALMFLAEHPELEPFEQRFDCVGLVLFRNIWPVRFVHLDNAWMLGA